MMSSMSVVRGVAIVTLAVALPACGAPAAQWRAEYLTPELVAHYGTRTYPIDRAVAMQATAASLRAAGYDVAFTNVERGMLKTGRKHISTTARSTTQRNFWGGHEGSAQAVEESMQYVARFLDAPGGGTTVVLDPRRYRGDNEITTTQPFWQGYLENQWSLLFEDIEAALPDAVPRPVNSI